MATLKSVDLPVKAKLSDRDNRAVGASDERRPKDEVERKLALIQSRFDKRLVQSYGDRSSSVVDLGAAGGLAGEARAIIAALEEFFPERPRPKFAPDIGEVEYASLRRLIGGVPWSRVDGLALVRNADWLSVLSFQPTMLRYSLPSYLTTYLTYWPTVLILWGHEPDPATAPHFERLFVDLDPTYYPGSWLYERVDRDQRECAACFVAFFRTYSALLYGEIEFTLFLRALSEIWAELPGGPPIGEPSPKT